MTKLTENQIWNLHHALEALRIEPGKDRTMSEVAETMAAAMSPGNTAGRVAVTRALEASGYDRAEAYQVVMGATGHPPTP